MDLFLWQITFVISIFFAVIICCLIPIILLRNAYNTNDVDYFWSKMLSWCDCLTGGVFLAMCFLGLLPNVQEQASDVLKGLQITTEFPVAECSVLLGFFIVLAIDQLCKRCDSSRIRTRRIIEMDSLGIVGGVGVGGGTGTEDDDYDVDGTSEDRCTLLTGTDGSVPNGNGEIGGGGGGGGGGSTYETSEELDSSIVPIRPTSEQNSRTRLHRGGSSSRVQRNHRHHGGHVLDITDKVPSSFHFLVLLFALSTHALFEGIVLGLQTEVTKAIHLFTAIVLHESVVAATLGFNIAKARHSVWKAIRYSLLFSVCIPVGIGLGMGVGQTPGTMGHAISGSLQAVAAGIFLHLTFMQMLPQEFAHGKDGVVKTLFLFIGFLLFTTLNLVMGIAH